MEGYCCKLLHGYNNQRRWETARVMVIQTLTVLMKKYNVTFITSRCQKWGEKSYFTEKSCTKIYQGIQAPWAGQKKAKKVKHFVFMSGEKWIFVFVLVVLSTPPPPIYCSARFSNQYNFLICLLLHSRGHCKTLDYISPFVISEKKGEEFECFCKQLNWDKKTHSMNIMMNSYDVVDKDVQNTFPECDVVTENLDQNWRMRIVFVFILPCGTIFEIGHR